MDIAGTYLPFLLAVSTREKPHTSIPSLSIHTATLHLLHKTQHQHNHEEGDHNPDAGQIRQVPGQGHESGGGGQRSGVRVAGRRRQEPAAGDRHRRGLEHAGEEAQEEGGRGGDRGAADARHLRAGGAPAPGDQAGGGSHGGGGAVAVQHPTPPPVAVQQLRRGAGQPVRLPVPLPPVAGGLRLRRLRVQLRVRGQRLLAGGGAEPPGQLLAAGGEARLPAHGPQLLRLQQADAERGGGAAPRRRQQHLRHTVSIVLDRVRR